MASSLLDDGVFSNFAFYASEMILKTVLMSPGTGFTRAMAKAFPNSEDCKFLGGKDSVPVLNDPSVERIRRCHLNDLENVIPFVLLGALYTQTNPDPRTALCVFRIFATSRLLHTVFYLGKVRQPARSIVFTVGLLVNVYMAVKVLSVARYS